jgi:hypothetical protein
MSFAGWVQTQLGTAFAFMCTQCVSLSMLIKGVDVVIVGVAGVELHCGPFHYDH